MRLRKRVLQGIGAGVLALMVGVAPAFANSVVFSYPGCSLGGFATVAATGTTSFGGTASFDWYECASGHGCGTTRTTSSEPGGTQVYVSDITAAPSASVQSVTISLPNGTLDNNPSGNCT